MAKAKVRWARARWSSRAHRLPPGTVETRVGPWHVLSHTREGFTRCGRDMSGMQDPQRRNSLPAADESACADCVRILLEPEQQSGLRGPTPHLVILDEVQGFAS